MTTSTPCAGPCHRLRHLGTACAIALSGCGGSTSNPPAPPAPVVSLQIQPIKTFRFQWVDVPDATVYRLLEDANSTATSVAGYAPVALIAAGVGRHDLVVSLPRRINARYILQACNAGGCNASAPVVVGGVLEGAVGYVKASNAEGGDFFGGPLGFSAVPVALSADGQTLAVGAVGESSSATGMGGEQADDSALFSGAVYVFIRQGTVWSQQAYVKATNTEARDAFGISLALSADGNTLAVGAYFEDSSASGIDGDLRDNGAPQSGAVYVYARSGGTWSPQSYVKAGLAKAGDIFGFSLALSGDGRTLAVGAFGDSSGATGIGGNPADSSAQHSGAVHVYSRSGAGWTPQAYVKASNTAAGADFGRSLSLSANGDTLAVGAVFESSGATGVNGDQTDRSALGSGAAYVFARSGVAWAQQAYVKAGNTGANDTFGASLALSADGDTLAVGAFRESSAATGIGGNAADDSAPQSGAVYVYTRSGGAWAQQAYLKAGNAAAGDSFGWALALSADGRTLAVGADGEDSGAIGLSGDPADNAADASGAVYLYSRSDAGWAPVAYLKATNTDSRDRFGVGLALSADGSTLAVGALGESSSATGIGGNPADNAAGGSGAVYLY